MELLHPDKPHVGARISRPLWHVLAERAIRFRYHVLIDAPVDLTPIRLEPATGLDGAKQISKNSTAVQSAARRGHPWLKAKTTASYSRSGLMLDAQSAAAVSSTRWQ